MEHGDVVRLWESGVKEDWDGKNEDAFRWNKVKDGYSYFVYGRKVLSLTESGRLKSLGKICQMTNGVPAKTPNGFYNVGEMDADGEKRLCEALKAEKKRIFRELIGEVFACCNDMNDCTREKRCVNSGERLYNGCIYRERMEKEWKADENHQA